MDFFNGIARNFRRRAPSEDAFAKVKEEKSNAVVTIEITHPRNFGLDLALSSSGTGFVVDMEKGLILTNKHIVNEGPCRAKAKFQKNEEIDLSPIYRDPVHDFGFFRFDPSHLIQTKPAQIELDPEGAVIGRNALLLGNNAGERLSFVQTTIARTDRNTADHLDMNTFYITASDTSVGGSSGAPLLSTQGKAIGMMAGGFDDANISMYLPLFRVQRAFQYIQNGELIPRGTMQMKLIYNTFEAFVKRNAITREIAEQVEQRFSGAEGMLVVDKNLPKGPARLAGVQNGDVLFKMNGNIVHNFVQYEEIIDSNIGQEITFTFIREKQEKEIKAVVQDHEEINVSRMVEVSNGIFHACQYRFAALLNLPIEGVFVAKEGYMFKNVPFASIIKRIAKTKITNLDDFIGAIQQLHNGELVSVAYQPISDPNKVEIRTVTVDKRWYPFQVAERDDKDGKWIYQDIEDLAKEKEMKETEVVIKNGLQSSGEPSKPELSAYLGAVVRIKCSGPFAIDGAMESTKSSCGIIIDKEKGLVLTNNEAVTSTLMDIELTFNEARIIEAKVVFVHPIQPFAVVKYDPQLLADDPVVSIEDVKLSSEKPKVGDGLTFVGLTKSYDGIITDAKVVAPRDTQIFGGEMRGFRMANAPMEYINVSAGSLCHGVYFSKKSGECVALGITPLPGMASITADLIPLIDMIRNKDEKEFENIRCLPVTLNFLSLSESRIHGLSDAWAKKLSDSMGLFQKKLLVIKRVKVTSDAHSKLFENDVILSIDNKVVTLIRDFYDAIDNKESVTLKVLRTGEEVEVTVQTENFSTLGTTRILHFGGLIIQDLHPAICFLSTPEILESGGVFVSHQEYGSPAESSEAQNVGVSSSLVNKIVYRLNGEAVHNLEDFIRIMKESKHQEFVRLMAKDVTRGTDSVHDIRLDLEYWKSRDMFLNDDRNWISHIIAHKE